MFGSSLPRRFRKPALLIIGCGDVGMRVVKLLAGRFRVTALTSSPERAPAFRAAGVRPVVGNLDQPRSLLRLASGCAPRGRVLHLAPPPNHGDLDTRTHHLLSSLSSLATPHQPRKFVYASTTGVYGDYQGAWIDETVALKPMTPRAVRRVDAEARVRHYGLRTGVPVTLVRIPGIYDGGQRSPRERLLKGTPTLAPADDVVTNHIHADDLARALIAALWRGKPQRVVNAVDDTQLLMGEYFDVAADAFGLPRPPRITRGQAEASLSAMQMSFMRESRRLRNVRLKTELRVQLHYPTVHSAFGVNTALNNNKVI